VWFKTLKGKIRNICYSKKIKVKYLLDKFYILRGNTKKPPMR